MTALTPEKKRYYRLWERYNSYLILTGKPGITAELFEQAFTLQQVTAIVEQKCIQNNLDIT